MDVHKNFTYVTYTSEIATLLRVEFSVFGNNEVKKYSVVKNDKDYENGISKAEDFNNNEPVPGGLADTKMGVSNNYLICGTCGQGTNTCPGHNAHLELAEAVFNVGFLPIVKNIISCVCIKCSNILTPKSDPFNIELSKSTKSNKVKFAELKAHCKNIKYCPKEECGSPVPKISEMSHKDNIKINAEYPRKATSDEESKDPKSKKKINYEITPEMCYSILKNISDEDCILMGFDPSKSRPEDMIIKTFPIPPVQIRPSVKIESSGSRADDLTCKIADIIRVNEHVRQRKHSTSQTSTKQIMTYMLQYHIATYFDNETISLHKSEQKNGKVTKSLRARLSGKDGRIRGNGMGKRVDLSARTVITIDPEIKINDVGMPLKIAMILTYQEIVTESNIEYLKQHVRNGPFKYPGANYVIETKLLEPGNEIRRTISLRHDNRGYQIKPGDIVERHLINGDFVLFNRQPSLHKMSMMGHRVHVIRDPSISTFRLNVNNTKTYGAD
jgi:DNA-directed RNA polymerase II subunit RPB1